MPAEVQRVPQTPARPLTVRPEQGSLRTQLRRSTGRSQHVPDSVPQFRRSSPSHQPVPGPLHTKARPTRPSEPFLVPKLRNQFADFPYLHCSTARGCSPWRPAADMGTARREIYTLSPGFSRASESSPDAAGTATFSRARAPLSGRTHSRAPCPSQRKENSPRGSRQLLRDRSRYRTGRLAAPVSATPDSGI